MRLNLQVANPQIWAKQPQFDKEDKTGFCLIVKNDDNGEFIIVITKPWRQVWCICNRAYDEFARLASVLGPYINMRDLPRAPRLKRRRRMESMEAFLRWCLSYKEVFSLMAIQLFIFTNAPIKEIIKCFNWPPPALRKKNVNDLPGCENLDMFTSILGPVKERHKIRDAAFESCSRLMKCAPAYFYDKAEEIIFQLSHKDVHFCQVIGNMASTLERRPLASIFCNGGYACPLNVFNEEFIRKMSDGVAKVYGNMQLAFSFTQSLWTYLSNFPPSSPSLLRPPQAQPPVQKGAFSSSSNSQQDQPQPPTDPEDEDAIGVLEIVEIRA